MATYEWTGASDTAFATGGNWSPSGPPTTGDTIIFNHKSTRAIAGSDQSAITLAKMIIYMSCGYDIGESATPLKIGCTAAEIGLMPQTGSGFNGPSNIVLDFHTIQHRTTVYGTGLGASTTGKENLRIQGSHASNELYIIAGKSIGIATNLVGDAARFATLNISGGLVNLGAGITNSPSVVLNDPSARVNIRCACSLELRSGEVTTNGDFLITTATLLGGVWYADHRNSSGAEITTLNIRGGVIDTQGNPEAFTVTNTAMRSYNIKMFSSAQWTFTNNPSFSMGDTTNISGTASS